MLPPVSEPKAKSEKPVATETTLPDEEPPGINPGALGF